MQQLDSWEYFIYRFEKRAGSLLDRLEKRASFLRRLTNSNFKKCFACLIKRWKANRTIVTGPSIAHSQKKDTGVLTDGLSSSLSRAKQLQQAILVFWNLFLTSGMESISDLLLPNSTLNTLYLRYFLLLGKAPLHVRQFEFH